MLEKVPAPVGHALAGVRPGLGKLVWADDGVAAPDGLAVSSAAFAEGGFIPARFTADGEGVSPPIAWSGVPAGAAEIVLVIEDADSPTPAPFVHALVFALPGRDQSLEAGALVSATSAGTAGALGKNTFRKAAYLPPDPPTGHGAHRYVVQVYALDRASGLAGEPEKHDVVAALTGHVIARGRTIGLYERPG